MSASLICRFHYFLANYLGALSHKKTAKAGTLSQPLRPPPLVRLGWSALSGEFFGQIFVIDFLDELGHCEHNTSRCWDVGTCLGMLGSFRNAMQFNE